MSNRKKFDEAKHQLNLLMYRQDVEKGNFIKVETGELLDYKENVDFYFFHENNKILLDKVLLVARPFRYLLLHKKENTICSNVDEVYPSLFKDVSIDRVSELHIAGRLDVDTTGLVLITDNGRWSYQIITPASQCPKVYRVDLSRPIADDAKVKFQHGVQLQGEEKLTLPGSLKIIAPTRVQLTITEGKFHQVKRMFAAVGNKVKALHREQIGSIVLDVEPGQWRYLTEAEINSFTAN